MYGVLLPVVEDGKDSVIATPGNRTTPPSTNPFVDRVVHVLQPCFGARTCFEGY